MIETLQLGFSQPLVHEDRRQYATGHPEPIYLPECKLWLFGNLRNLAHPQLFHLPEAAGPNIHSRKTLDEIEAATESAILGGRMPILGIHNAAHERSAVVPLRWGAPRILVFSGGFHYHLGEKLNQEPFRAARLWRYEFDPLTDLVISRRAPEKKPTCATNNPTVDRLIAALATGLAAQAVQELAS